MHLKDLGNLTTAIKSFIKTGSLVGNVNNVLEKSFKDLNASQILARVSIFKLSDAQKLELVRQYATNAANYTTIESITALATAEEGATVATGSLTLAWKGLAQTLGISVMALNAIAVGIGILTVGAMMYKRHVQEQKELADATTESAKAYQDSTSK